MKVRVPNRPAVLVTDLALHNILLVDWRNLTGSFPYFSRSYRLVQKIFGQASRACQVLPKKFVVDSDGSQQMRPKSHNSQFGEMWFWLHLAVFLPRNKIDC